MMAAPNIFISYRRADSQHITDRLAERLEAAFGKGHVFQDVDRIPLGADFRTYLSNEIQRCQVILLVIGPQWTRSLKEREAQADDYVRVEVEQALSQKKHIIPVLVDGAMMPTPADLPESLADLSYLNAARLRPNPDFTNDMDFIIGQIRAVRTSPPKAPRQVIAPAPKPVRIPKPTSATLPDRLPTGGSFAIRRSYGVRVAVLSIGMMLATLTVLLWFLNAWHGDLSSRQSYIVFSGQYNSLILNNLAISILVGLIAGVSMEYIILKLAQRQSIPVLQRLIFSGVLSLIVWAILFALIQSAMHDTVRTVTGVYTYVTTYLNYLFVPTHLFAAFVLAPLTIGAGSAVSAIFTRHWAARLAITGAACAIAWIGYYLAWDDANIRDNFEAACIVAGILMSLGLWLADRLSPQSGTPEQKPIEPSIDAG